MTSNAFAIFESAFAFASLDSRDFFIFEIFKFFSGLSFRFFPWLFTHVFLPFRVFSFFACPARASKNFQSWFEVSFDFFCNISICFPGVSIISDSFTGFSRSCVRFSVDFNLFEFFLDFSKSLQFFLNFLADS